MNAKQHKNIHQIKLLIGQTKIKTHQCTGLFRIVPLAKLANSFVNKQPMFKGHACSRMIRQKYAVYDSHLITVPTNSSTVSCTKPTNTIICSHSNHPIYCNPADRTTNKVLLIISCSFLFQFQFNCHVMQCNYTDFVA